MISRDYIEEFVAESNAIEGILRPPEEEEIQAHVRVLGLGRVTIGDVEDFVRVIQPGASLRREKGMDVRVGSYIPPPGGPGIEADLAGLLEDIDIIPAYDFHLFYESLHPFTDGNGRSGRALWLWKIREREDPKFGFLHSWYYWSLKYARRMGGA